MRFLSLALLASAFVTGCDDRFSNFPVCQTGQIRECNRPNGERGQQVCGPLGYWTTSCDARDAATPDDAIADASVATDEDASPDVP